MRTKQDNETTRQQDDLATGHQDRPIWSRRRVVLWSHRLAFTLIELLVVIGIITVLAGLLFPVARTVKREAFIHNAQGQMAQLETAIARYHSVYGFYPPGSSMTIGTNIPVPVSQLYYELEGTMQTNISGTPYYVTLDHYAQIKVADVTNAFGAAVSGFMNCSKPGASESSVPAQNFLPNLNTNQVSAVTINGVQVDLMVTPNGGPDTGYNPLGTANFGINPWRYVYPGTNNPGSYDLWVQLEIGGNTNLICNWNRQVQINTPLP